MILRQALNDLEAKQKVSAIIKILYKKKVESQIFMPNLHENTKYLLTEEFYPINFKSGFPFLTDIKELSLNCFQNII